jgi:hypothetical protein
MTAKALRCVGRRAYTSNEIDVVPIDAEARPSRGEAEGSRDTPNRRPPGKHNAPLASETANSLNTAPPAT